jgi:hypothetical protein
MAVCKWAKKEPGGEQFFPEWHAKTPTGLCTIQGAGKKKYEWFCTGKNGQTTREFDYSTVQKAKSDACAWLNDPEATKSREQIKQEYAAEMKKFMASSPASSSVKKGRSFPKPSMNLVWPLAVIAAGAAGFGICRMTK